MEKSTLNCYTIYDANWDYIILKRKYTYTRNSNIIHSKCSFLAIYTYLTRISFGIYIRVKISFRKDFPQHNAYMIHKTEENTRRMRLHVGVVSLRNQPIKPPFGIRPAMTLPTPLRNTR